MVHVLTELSKYLLIVLFAIYTVWSFFVFRNQQDSFREKRIYRRQTVCMFLIHFFCYAIMFAVKLDIRLWIFYLAQVGFCLLIFLIYRVIYKYAARLIVNHMCMLMLIGFIFLNRLDFKLALRQFEIAVIATVFTAFIPMLVVRFDNIRRLTWVFGIVGIFALAVVAVLGPVTNGARLSFSVGGVTLQPSEFVKILFVFFIACRLYWSIEFRDLVITTIAAALYVIILVLSTDLGSALIFFITYICMLYAATRKPLYFAAGVGVGVLAALGASKVFSHVQTRIQAWKDPFASYSTGGYQIAQALFAIGTGGWFGMGLYQGMPDKIPIGESDFIFAGITEEFGAIFSICIILVCLSCFIMIIRVAREIRDPFYKLVALGFGCIYGTQVFLNIGGVIKCIPSTGVTLPFISYGGSSVFCTIIMFAVIQGLYIYRHNEGEMSYGNLEKSEESQDR